MSAPLPVDYLVAVVAHRALLADRLPSYLALLIENGFSLLHQTHVILSPAHTSLLLGQGVESDSEVFAPTTPACVVLLQRVDAYAIFNGLREQLDFVYGSVNRWTALRDQHTFFPPAPTLERALLVLKPGYSQEDYAAVLDTLEVNAFITLDMKGKILTNDEAILLCSPSELPSFTSDVSLFLALERLNAQATLTLLLGPASPTLARAVAPTTLRARLSSALYCSATPEQAAQDARICWPDGFALQRTVAVLGGPAVDAESEVSARLEAEGFSVIRRDRIFLSRARLDSLWAGRLDSAKADSVLSQWAAAPSVALLLTKPAAVSHWRVVVESLACRDFVFASTAESAGADARAVFPLLPPAPQSLTTDEVLARFTAPLPTPTPTATPASLQSVLTTALIALCKAKPAADDAVTWLAHWLLAHNPNAPTVTGPLVTPVDDDDAAVKGSTEAVQSVWVVGDGLDRMVAELVRAQGFVHVDVDALLAAAVANNAEVGLAISEFVNTDRPTPSALVLPLIQRAINAAQPRPTRLVLTRFPRDLDQAFAYEAAVGPVGALVVGRGVGERLGRGGDDGVEGVLEHYRVFGRVVEVDVEATAAEAKATTGAVQRLLQAIQL